MSFLMIALGEVLTKSDEWIDINPNEQYRQVTVRLWGKGVVLREKVNGSEIAAQRRLVVRSKQFIVSRIDARNGAFGLIPDSLDGSVVSSDFPVFIVNPSRILPKYLNWMSKTHFFVDLCKAASEGTTNRVRLQEDRFLAAKIPLPSLSEQRRTVARIEDLAAKIEEARGLRKKAGEEVEALMLAEMAKIFNNAQEKWKVSPIIECPVKLNHETRNPANENPNDEFQYLDISSVEGGTGRILGTQKLLGRDAPSRARRVIRQGNIVMSTVRPNLKSFTIIPPELDNQICSTGFAVFSCHSDIDPKFLLHQMFSNYFVDQCIESMKGGHYPAVNEKNLQQINLILPPLPEQRRIVAYLDALQAKVDVLRCLQAETGAELDALMPAVLDRAFKGELR